MLVFSISLLLAVVGVVVVGFVSGTSAKEKRPSSDVTVSTSALLRDMDRVMHPFQQGLQHWSYAATDIRFALVVTLAGNRKLAPYFEWSCRSIGASKAIADMLVFHENNQQLLHVKCAQNVKFINLGERGLSELIVRHILGNNTLEDTVSQLANVVNNVLTHMPKYLVETKPMTGTLFASHLSQYSHWTYTDPDILWGDLSRWLDKSDVMNHDIITIATNFDAARLYLRGQVFVY
jgi:hypothetical protein